MSTLIDKAENITNSASVDDRLYSVDNLKNKITSNDKLVFFTGAGFSKAWSEKYPAGFELFSITDAEDQDYNFFHFAREMGIIFPKEGDFIDKSDFAKACYDFFKEIKFHLDVYKRYPSLMASFLDRTTIFALEREIIDFIKSRFSSFVGGLELKIGLPPEDKISVQARNLINFFHSFIREEKDISFVTTNYDFVLEKILYGYSEGSICLNRGLINKSDFSEKRWSKNRVCLFKINGGFEIDGCDDNININYSFEDSKSNIILPSQEQNYDNKYFKSVFIKSANKLRAVIPHLILAFSVLDGDRSF